MNIGNAIKDLRINKSNQTQVQFCESIGITQTYLSQIESNKKTPSKDVLEKISFHLAIPMSILAWWSIDETDIPKDKLEAFKLMKPSMDDLINSVFKN